MNYLDQIQEFVEAQNSSNSNTDKLNVLKQYADNENVRKALEYTYNTFKQFGVTSANCKKRNDLIKYGYTDLFKLLDDLESRFITGHLAISSVNGFVEANKRHEDLIFNIIDRNLKTRSTTSMINKVIPDLIPTFDVALANAYNEKTAAKINWADGYFVSRKLDGVRCITIIDADGEIKFFSRAGNEFLTLNALKPSIYKLGLTNKVLDGEICIVDVNGNEDFTSIIKEIKRKDHTITNPFYFMFDMLTLADFTRKESTTIIGDRLAELKIITNDDMFIKVLPQYLASDAVFEDLMAQSKEGGWEGLMIRKNSTYQGKRSNDILKVKAFQDAEYIVVDLENAVNRVIVEGKEVEELMLKNIIIEHKGSRVQVGSGFSHEQKRYYFENPTEILGKQVTVQYFEETKNDRGTVSLRFPVIKHIWENGRNC